MDLLNQDKHTWERYTGTSLGRTVDYSGTILGFHDDAHVDVLYRWAPNAYCHFHRQFAPASSIVLEGEFHVYDYVDGKEVGHRIRQVGDYSHTSGIEDHIEQGGPEGALVIFSLYAPDGVLTQRLDDDGSVMQTVTLDALKTKHTALL